jgi:hypothetical protein
MHLEQQALYLELQRVAPVGLSSIRTRPQVGTTKDTREAKNRVGDGLAVIQPEWHIALRIPATSHIRTNPVSVSLSRSCISPDSLPRSFRVAEDKIAAVPIGHSDYLWAHSARPSTAPVIRDEE